jgi:MFS family permease
LIVVTILCFASFMVVLGYIVPSIGENERIGFAASGTLTALLFITPGALAQLITGPLVGRLAAKIGFVTVLRAGLIGAVAVTALLAVFALDKGDGHRSHGRVRNNSGCRTHPAERAGRPSGARG